MVHSGIEQWNLGSRSCLSTDWGDWLPRVWGYDVRTSSLPQPLGCSFLRSHLSKWSMMISELWSRSSTLLWGVVFIKHQEPGAWWMSYHLLASPHRCAIGQNMFTVSARIIERSQEDKSTVKYRTFVLLRVPIRSGVGKFNYRTGRRTKVRYFTVLLSSWLRSIISGTDMIFTAYLYIYNL